MKTLMDFGLKEAYKRVERLGNRLAEIESLMDWEAFRPIVGDMYDNKSEQGGRPNIDEVVMIKLLVLQQWYGLSDPELERQAADRLSFIKFLGFPADIPDFTTVWKFRERLAKTGKDQAIWAELQRQLDARGLGVKQSRELSRMQRLLPLIPDMRRQISREERKRRRAEARMARGQRRAANPISATSFTVSWIQSTASFASSKRPPHRFTTVR